MSQEALVEALAEAGEPATQATVSRDLAAIGALKGPGGYRLPDEPASAPAAGSAELEAAVRRHVVRIDRADSLVVVRTAPGHAGLVGAALDRWPPEGMVGTVAGDDTIFIATPSSRAASALASTLSRMLSRVGGAA